MTETILFDDVEAMVIGYLTPLVDVAVSTKVPAQRPDAFIKVSRAGGTKRRINAESAMLTFQCWGSNTLEASDLARKAKAHIHAMAGKHVGGTWVFRVTEVGGLGFNPDPKTNEPRYQFTVSIDTKGSAL